MAIKSKSDTTLQIEPLKQGRLSVKIIGLTPIYFNSMSVKVRRDLLIGSKKKTTAEKREIKHDPETEFRDSMYTLPDGPTLLAFPAPGIKKAMATAALYTEGVNKTDVNRLIFLPSYRIRIWGRPYLKMDVVRSADMNRTPDVRTRAFLPEWCAEVDVAFVTPTLTAKAIVSLIANAGIISGIGDFRQEKGSGSFGSFAVVSDKDQEKAFGNLVKHEGRDVQIAACENPEAADDDTRALWATLRQERMRRAA